VVFRHLGFSLLLSLPDHIAQEANKDSIVNQILVRVPAIQVITPRQILPLAKQLTLNK